MVTKIEVNFETGNYGLNEDDLAGIQGHIQEALTMWIEDKVENEGGINPDDVGIDIGFYIPTKG